MDMVKRLVAVALVAIAFVVGLNLILTPVYHDGGPTYPVCRSSTGSWRWRCLLQ